MIDIRKFREHHNLTVRALAQRIGMSPSQLNEIETGKKAQPQWLGRVLEGPSIRDELSAKVAQTPNSEMLGQQYCPICQSVMRNGSNYLTHWFFGPLRARVICRGRFRPRHAPLVMGIPFGSPQNAKFQRLDHTTNPNTGIDVPLMWKKHKSWYERKCGWVWCDSSSGRPDGCGNLCCACGAYAYHAGRTFQIFTCMNRKCKYYRRRLKCRGGSAFAVTPSVARKTSLPHSAKKCPHCGGPTVRKALTGVPHGQVQVVCKSCRKISYFSVTGKRFVQGPKRGGPLRDDPFRPNCFRCSRPMMRRAVTRKVYERDPLRVPLPVRKQLQSGLAEWPPSHEIAVQYTCNVHRTSKNAEM